MPQTLEISMSGSTGYGPIWIYVSMTRTRKLPTPRSASRRASPSMYQCWKVATRSMLATHGKQILNQFIINKSPSHPCKLIVYSLSI